MGRVSVCRVPRRVTRSCSAAATSVPSRAYFPEVVTAIVANVPDGCVLDGEIVIAGAAGLDFDALLNRIHPADSRVRKLAEETPASFVALTSWPSGRKTCARARSGNAGGPSWTALAGTSPPMHLTPASESADVARDWFARFEGAGLDGVIAKNLDGTVPGGPTGMDQGQARADCRLRRRGVPVAQGGRQDRIPPARPLRRRRRPSSRRRDVLVHRCEAARARRGAGPVPAPVARRATPGRGDTARTMAERGGGCRAPRAVGTPAATCPSSPSASSSRARSATTTCKAIASAMPRRSAGGDPIALPSHAATTSSKTAVPEELAAVFAAGG